ncbi:hypothetical protein VTK56DRAFT_9425 [Thermocarpiscus australiensis]
MRYLIPPRPTVVYTSYLYVRSFPSKPSGETNTVLCHSPDQTPFLPRVVAHSKELPYFQSDIASAEPLSEEGRKIPTAHLGR